MSPKVNINAVDVAPDLIVQEGESLKLLAGRDLQTGRIVFPLPEGDWQSRYSVVELPETGMLWAWTVQYFCPKSPYDGDLNGENFKPFAVGYVEFDGIIRVEGRLVLDDFSNLATGLCMRTIAYPYRTQEDGTRVLTYAFEPAEVFS